ncbi:DUF2163 domain-containing protein [Primorskyibacter sp. S87]|uniref:DUF2163 domain-containing protein n=1 Tax=Primorskyibacter sp. S87 TaxID=3415126 RepID=UPI003C7CA0D3
MHGMTQDFRTHLKTGLTTLCRCWAIKRRDGKLYGFTDHDRSLEFDGIVFKAESGLSATALQQGTGLSVDNTEAIGALCDAAIRDADIEAGRFDDADVQAWLVNWADPDVRWLQFRGTIGEIRRADGAFHAELRGLTAALNQPLGRIYQKPCTAVLGDARCGFDVETPGYSTVLSLAGQEENRIFRWASIDGFEPGLFIRGVLKVQSGDAAGLWGLIKHDRQVDRKRVIELWEPIRGEIQPGDTVRLEAGCDKRMETCALKFGNILNFSGFPDLPEEDWVVAVPKTSQANPGGSRR